jgi:hypothetical protein
VACGTVPNPFVFADDGDVWHTGTVSFSRSTLGSGGDVGPRSTGGVDVGSRVGVARRTVGRSVAIDSGDGVATDVDTTEIAVSAGSIGDAGSPPPLEQETIARANNPARVVTCSRDLPRKLA